MWLRWGANMLGSPLVAVAHAASGLVADSSKVEGSLIVGIGLVPVGTLP